MSDLDFSDFVDEYRSNPPAASVTEAAIVSVQARRPKKTDWVRAHPDLFLDVLILVYEEEGSEVEYLVHPNKLVQQAAHRDAEGLLRPVRLTPAIDRDNVLFLWTAKLPTGAGRGESWYSSGLRCLELAKERWVRVTSNRATSSYDAVTLKGVEVPDPDWGDLDLGQLLSIAFEGKVIDSIDHDVLRKLRGDL